MLLLYAKGGGVVLFHQVNHAQKYTRFGGYNGKGGVCLAFCRLLVAKVRQKIRGIGEDEQIAVLKREAREVVAMLGRRDEGRARDGLLKGGES